MKIKRGSREIILIVFAFLIIISMSVVFVNAVSCDYEKKCSLALRAPPSDSNYNLVSTGIYPQSEIIFKKTVSCDECKCEIPGFDSNGEPACVEIEGCCITDKDCGSCERCMPSETGAGVCVSLNYQEEICNLMSDIDSIIPNFMSNLDSLNNIAFSEVIHQDSLNSMNPFGFIQDILFMQVFPLPPLSHEQVESLLYWRAIANQLSPAFDAMVNYRLSQIEIDEAEKARMKLELEIDLLTEKLNKFDIDLNAITSSHISLIDKIKKCELKNANNKNALKKKINDKITEIKNIKKNYDRYYADKNTPEIIKRLESASNLIDTEIKTLEYLLFYIDEEQTRQVSEAIRPEEIKVPESLTQSPQLLKMACANDLGVSSVNGIVDPKDSEPAIYPIKITNPYFKIMEVSFASEGFEGDEVKLPPLTFLYHETREFPIEIISKKMDGTMITGKILIHWNFLFKEKGMTNSGDIVKDIKFIIRDSCSVK